MTQRCAGGLGLLVFSLVAAARADGPGDNRPANVRPVPPPGVKVSDDDRKALESGLAELQSAIARLRQRTDRKTVELLPDVEVFYRAVHDALTYREFFTPREIPKGKELLHVGLLRAQQLLAGAAPWTRASGLVVRGYRSRIDGSVQPYGLVVPGVDAPGEEARGESDVPQLAGAYRLDVWFHGRGETLSEMNFLDEHRRSPGQFTPPGTIVLHPYGRYCNAFKFAGEVDVLEAIDAVRRNYRIDDDRIAVRGFSMGGAACWQFAVHYADRWFAANPGAGFSETPLFLKVFQNESLKPTWYEKALWNLYDCPGYALNLAHCPTVAYSGELDSQKQAADVMEAALRAQGIDLVHIIGPKTKHQYHPDAKREVERRMNHLAERGRQRNPEHVSLVTYTLKYPKMDWVTIDALGEHWKQATVHVERKAGSVSVITKNVQALTLEDPPGWSPFPILGAAPIEVTVDETTLQVPRPRSDRSWRCALHRQGNAWVLGGFPDNELRKRHNLQGPIDDGFMDAFVFVRPTSRGTNASLDSWVKQESARAVEHWRRQFRGDARVVDDAAIDDQLIASSNLVLWGDSQSNSVLKRIADRLPIRWNGRAIKAGDKEFSTENHALIMIYPNPLNPQRYVVLNSGFTYREYDYLNNARQVPKLPDWAVIDLRTPPDSRSPGAVVAADFFGERWELRPVRTDR